MPSTSTTPQGPAAAQPELPPSAWLWVLVLCLAQIVSTMDRGMLALVIDPVRADLAISDVQIALLIGFAFGAFYTTVGLPMGLLADRASRRRLLIAGISVWSLATAAGGIAQNFGELFASRLFIGIGEAVLAPCAVTIISDAFPASARGRPMALYMFGSMTAHGVGSLLTGYVLQLAPQGVFDSIARLQGLAPWRIAFLLAGLSGLVIVVLILPLREPQRQGSTATGGRAGTEGWRTTAAYFRARRRLFLPLYACLACFGAGASVANGWGAALLTRVFGYQVGRAGQSLGTAQILWALVGAVLAAVVVDRVARRAGTAGKIRLAALFGLCAIPASLAGAAGSGPVAALMLSEMMFASAMFGTTMLSVVPEITPVGFRGVAVALYALVMTMVGGSLGPLAVAALTERLFQDPAAVGTSMAIVGSVALVGAALFALAAARALQAEASTISLARSPA